MAEIAASTTKWFGKVAVEALLGALVIAGATTLLAWWKGLAFHWALLVGVAVAFGLAGVANFVSLIIARHHEPQQGGLDEAKEKELEKALALNESKLLTSDHTVTTLRSELEATNRQYNDTKWLRGIAEDQATVIAKYVTVECWIVEHDLLRDSPFIDFQVRFHSACVYKLSFVALSGSVRFANQRLSGNAFASRNLLDKLGINEVGWVTLTQPLTRDDAIRILNQPNEFYFDYIRIELQASPGAHENVVVQPRGSVKSAVLYDRYPKLDIEVKNAVSGWLLDSREGILNSKEPYFATLQISVTNRRRVTIAIEMLKLVMMIEGKHHVAYVDAGSHVSLQRNIAVDGSEATTGVAISNLNASSPLRIPPDRPSTGALQFTFEEIQYMGQFADLIDQIGKPPVANPLDSIPFTLFLIDKDGEEHQQRGVLTFNQDERRGFTVY